MSETKLDAGALEEDLKKIAEGGIQTDRRHLLKDMCGQFPDPREWIREYVVNGYDAGARTVWIEGREDEETYTICVEDDGRGMDRKGVRDFVTVFRSVKSGDRCRIVGRHGVGKLSVAAVEGQCGYHMTTSTGTECWRMRTTCLLDDTPIVLERTDTPAPRGTRFEIAFRKNNASLRDEMLKLIEVLKRYVRYLPIDIAVDLPGPPEDQWLHTRVWIRAEWAAQSERFGQAFSFTLSGQTYEVVLGIGPAVQEVYQNRVLVSDSYSLLSFDLDRTLSIPHIRIRLNSPDFELPFGRHRLMNEGVLREVSRYLRQDIIPRYAADLCLIYESEAAHDFGVSCREIEEIVCSLMGYDPSPKRSWCQLPVFSVLNDPHRPRYSLNEIRQVVQRTGHIYLEDQDNPGVDYSVFDSPVLARRQPQGAQEILSSLFKKGLVNLGIHDTVLIAPAGSSPELGPREKAFQKQLRFHPDAVHRARERLERQKAGSGSSRQPSILTRTQIQRMLGTCEEAQQAKQDLAAIRWQVNYLVGRDGKTPCITHRFLMRDNTVVLNLHHKDVRRLVDLSEKTPNLAGHWGLAMCLAEGNTILPHLTPEARADLILADAVAKAGNSALDDLDEIPAEDINDPAYREFLRNIEDEDLRWD